MKPHTYRVETSLAGSATLRDTSWARLTIELTSWNLPDSQHCLESTYFVNRGTIWVGTTNNIDRKNLYGRVGGWVDGWMGGWGIPSGNIATSWLHLASWNLLDSQLC